MPQVQHEYHIRDRESFQYAQEIIKPFGTIDSVIAWCKAELESEWRWQLVEVSSDIRPGRYIFYMDSQRDACAFSLKWG